MKALKRIGLSLLVLLLVGTGAYWHFFGPEPEYEDKLLVFSKTDGFRHESIEPGIEAVKRLGRKQKFSVVATEDPSVFNPNSLSAFKAVMFLSTTGDVLDARQQEALERYIQAGGGYVGVHSAADTEWQGNSWPWYTRLVGAAFLSHPNDPSNVQIATIKVVDANHASTSHLPDEWTREDEWYDFQRFYPQVNVLLEVDESTYQGAVTGGKHPIAWYHDYDGGRSFYTALGHTPESFQEPAFLEHLAGGISYAMGEDVSLDYSKAKPESWRFRKQILDAAMDEPMAMAFREDGSLYFVERKGALRRFDKARGESELIATLPVYHRGENGLQGISFHIDSASNEWLYLFHTLESIQGVTHTVARYPVQGDVIGLENGETLIEIPIDAGDLQHVGGGLQFDSAGNLWISVGDNTNPHESAGYSPTDYGEDRTEYDAARGAGNTQDLRGKILRITPLPEGGYDIPEGNLFSNPEEGRPEIFVMGVRNPFRFSVDTHTNTLYWGEVGPDADDDSDIRGPRGYDEFNRTSKAGNFGWPFVIGNNFPYGRYDYATGTSSGLQDPAAVINDSPRNTGLNILPPARPAWIYYPYMISDEFLELGMAGRSAMAGPVYYYDDFPDNDEKLPEYYDGKLLIYDWVRRWIKAVSMDASGNIEKIESFMGDTYFSAPIDMKLAPDGSLYLLEYGSAWFSQNDDAYLTRIAFYASDNPPPAAVIASSNTVGAAPLYVDLSAADSYDPNGAPEELSYEWALLENGKVLEVLSDQRDYRFAAVTAGEYDIQLTVTDKDGAQSLAGLVIQAGNDAPEISLSFPGANASFYWGEASIPYQVEVTDTEDGRTADGSIDPAQVTVSFDFLPEGLDIASIAQGHQQQADSDAGLGQMSNSDCLACHQQEKTSVGPSFLDIAERYQGDETAVELLSQKVIKGGGGNWGKLAMPPHPQLEEATVREMISYILDPDAGTQGMPLSGTIEFNRHVHQTTQADDLPFSINPGQYVMNVSYKDRGAPGAKRQKATASNVFRHPVLGIADMDETYEMMIAHNAALGDLSIGVYKITADPGTSSYARLNNIDLKGVSKIRCYLITSGMITTGGELILRSASPDGQELARASVENEGLSLPTAINSVAELDVSHVDERNDLFFIGHTEEESNKGVVFILLAIEFLK